MAQEIKPWTTLHSELVVDHRWYQLRRDHVQLPTGQQLDDYFVSVRANVALVFALTDDQHVLFVRQYKHGIGEILTELPGGVVDAGETSPLAAARRELLEETGYASDDLEQLAEVSDNPTKDTNRIYFFLARNARRVAAQHLDETENIEVLKVPLADIERMILSGQIKVAGSIALGLLALRKLGL
ncbi:NUDIX hydrolase [Hymenobacter sp. BT186]|uniref:GDP-mannose pyrophosphatase n=1 Tax=Hymenobacter telluris TaxID=2816474 RepID=A0A939J976_9BACT|nr:NUDIX hydrolase [Hymenobacter telluris]MBO0358524.1 NUDIX hydrolase [Hymenobacter telluris]MBW3374550.1 NUDIX hydrolase [Hymenobacter norwichensis]